MTFNDTTNFWRLDILADVCFKETTGQLTLVEDLPNDQRFTLRVFKDPFRVIKAKELHSMHAKKHSFHPFTPYLAPSSVKAKRKRASPWQLAILRDAFLSCPFPSMEEKRRLAGRVGMTERAVQIWFQNSRQAAKEKCKVNY